MTDEARAAAARSEAALGEDAMRAADALLPLGLPNDAVSRAYYAAFHFARALLLCEGLEPKTHRGVIALLAQHFEASGRLSSHATSALARLQTFRGLADYDASERIAPARAAKEVASAHRFVDETRSLLEALLAET